MSKGSKYLAFTTIINGFDADRRQTEYFNSSNKLLISCYMYNVLIAIHFWLIRTLKANVSPESKQNNWREVESGQPPTNQLF